MSAIAVEGLSKLWGDTRAVDRVSFDAGAGSFTVLLGPSGCGKSTTLRLIAGLEAADEGRISIGGKDLTDAAPADRSLSMVFQSYALFPHLTVAENIIFGLKVRRTGRQERQARLTRTAELLGLSDLLQRRPSQLSGGQQQRVALGRAIIAEKPVCLMDEPLSNLDAKLRHEMRIEIRALQRELGVSMVYVTHDQAEAMSMADRVILLNDGKVEQDAPPAELYQRPATTFAARFIGTPPMNLIPLAPGGNGACVAGTDSVAAPADAAGCVLGVRPENIQLVDSGGLRATVTAVEYLGADSVMDCQLGSATVAVRTPGIVAPAPGATVSLGWAPHDCHFFDAAGGQRRDDVNNHDNRTGEPPR